MSKVMDRIQAFKQSEFDRMIKECTQEQKDRFKCMYPDGPNHAQFDWALQQVERSVNDNIRFRENIQTAIKPIVVEVIKRFEVGQKLATSSHVDHETIYTSTVLKRNPKSIVITGRNGKPTLRKIYVFDGVEVIYPFGTYSMAPSFRAEPYR